MHSSLIGSDKQRSITRGAHQARDNQRTYDPSIHRLRGSKHASDVPDRNVTTVRLLAVLLRGPCFGPPRPSRLRYSPSRGSRQRPLLPPPTPLFPLKTLMAA